MKLYDSIGQKSFTVKNCAFCDRVFYAKRDSAVFCSTSCKQKFYFLKKKSLSDGYNDKVNGSKKLPPGTLPSYNISEDKVVLKSDLTNLYRHLESLMTEEQLNEEKQFIDDLSPFTQTHSWSESVSQIFTDEHFIEVFRTQQSVYKLYVCPAEDGSKQTLI